MIKIDNKGFTLIEILVAIYILMIGLVGILAMFPFNIKQESRDADRITGYIISESVMDAIRVGVDGSDPMDNDTPKAMPITITHDGFPEGSYTLYLPADSAKGIFFVYPNGPYPPGAQKPVKGTDESGKVFLLNSSSKGYIRNLIDDSECSVKKFDPTDPYGRISFRIAVRRVDPKDLLMAEGISSTSARVPQYEFRVSIYKNYDEENDKKQNLKKATHPNLIFEKSAILTGK